MRIIIKLKFILLLISLPLIAEACLFSQINLKNIQTKEVIYRPNFIAEQQVPNGEITASANMWMIGAAMWKKVYSSTTEYGQYLIPAIIVILLLVFLIVFLLIRSNYFSNYNSMSNLKSSDKRPRRLFRAVKQTRDELWKSEQKYRLIFEAAANIIILIDKKAVVLDCNSQIQKMLGYTQDKIINRSIENIIHLDFRKQIRDSFL